MLLTFKGTMTMKLFWHWMLLVILTLPVGCTREPQGLDAMLAQIPADTPYVMVVAEPLPQALWQRLIQLDQTTSGQQFFAQLQQGGAAEARLGRLLQAAYAELQGLSTAAQWRAAGLEPQGRSVVYGLGVLPILRSEIADAKRLEALLERIAQRVGADMQVEHRGELSYRRVGFGPIDLLIGVHAQELVIGLVPHDLLASYLPLVLGQQRPSLTLLAENPLPALRKQYGLSAHAAGYLDMVRLLDVLLDRGEGYNAATWAALRPQLPQADALTPGCVALARAMAAGMPRVIGGVHSADTRRLDLKILWEASPAVGPYLERLAVPVPGLGSPASAAMLALGISANLPEWRNGLTTLMNRLIAAADSCDAIDPARLQAGIVQLNLALGPLTAGIKGLHIQLHDLELDTQMQPQHLRASLLAAVDDPRGVLAMLGMFSPQLAQLQLPRDGTPVALTLADAPPGTPPLAVAAREQALLLLAGTFDPAQVQALFDAPGGSPAANLALTYDVPRFAAVAGTTLAQVSGALRAQGDDDTADVVQQQLVEIQRQAATIQRVELAITPHREGIELREVITLR